MAKFIKLAAILLLAFGTLGFNNSICDNTKRNVKRKKIERTTRTNVLNSAKRWLGVFEITGRNDHPMIKRSMEICGLCGTCGYPWCASSHSEIFLNAGIFTTRSARAADFFKANVVWLRSWGDIPKELLQPGMSLGYWYEHLKRIGHIGLLVGWDKNNLYVYEGNTSPNGLFNPENLQPISATDTSVVREGDGFYPKTRSWYDIAVISDKCLGGKDFDNRYYDYLKLNLTK